MLRTEEISEEMSIRQEFIAGVIEILSLIQEANNSSDLIIT